MGAFYELMLSVGTGGGSPYSPTTGRLTVTLTGASGGQWSADGGSTWMESGESLTLVAGTYTVTFSEVAGYDAPSSMEATVVVGETTDVTATYAAYYPIWESRGVFQTHEGTYGGSTLVSSAMSAATLVVSGSRTAITGEEGHGYVYVFSGGVVSSCTVGYHGHLIVSGGGVVSSCTDGYLATVCSGGVLSSCTVDATAVLGIESGGTLGGATVLSGGTMTVSGGGTVTSTTVSSGGTMTVKSGGTAQNVTRRTGATVVSSAGAVITYA